jgi:glycine oxidase
VVVAGDRDDAEELHRLHALHESLGLGSTWLPPSALRREEPGLSPRVAGGILAPGDALVSPRAVVGALAAAVERAGGAIAHGAEVVGLETDGGRVSSCAPRAATCSRAPTAA